MNEAKFRAWCEEANCTLRMGAKMLYIGFEVGLDCNAMGIYKKEDGEWCLYENSPYPDGGVMHRTVLSTYNEEEAFTVLKAKVERNFVI